MEPIAGQDLLRSLLENLPEQADGQVIPRFLEFINAYQPGLDGQFFSRVEDHRGDLTEEINTGQHSFGWITFSEKFNNLPEAIQSSLRASVKLLAFVLENRLVAQQVHPDGNQYLVPEEILESANEGVIIYDRELRYRVWNPFMEKLTGLPAGQVLGKTAFELFPHLKEQGIDALLQRALNGETVNSSGFAYYIPGTGRRGWALGTYRPYHSPGGDTIGVVATVHDITASKELEEKMRRERDLLSRVMETSPSGILIIDLEGQITFANQRAEEVLGLQPGSRPQHIDDLPWTVDDADGKRIPAENRPVRRVLETGIPVTGQQHSIHKPGGDQVTILLNASPLFDASGEIEAVVVMVEDITTQREAQAALVESEDRYELAVNGANDGIWDWNLKNGRVYFSPRWKSIIGYENDPLPERIDAWFNRIHPADYWQFKADLNAHLAGESSHLENEHRILHKDGQYRWVLARGMAVRDAEGKAYRMAGSLTDITRQKVTEERLRHDAMHDTLTHLPNRAYFIDQVRRAIDRARRNIDYQGAVLYLDLDRFKIINESLGHASGDQLLVAISRRLQALLRPRDVISRFGGDEFAILLDDITGVGDATRIAQRIQEELAYPYRIQDHEIYPGASIGIAMITTSSIRAEDVLRDADTAMYRAKAGGRGRHQVFGTEMHAMNIALFELEAELRRAVERKQFQLYYQPIVSLETGKITTVEALIRWQHPRRGLILPGEFIILAEETGLILPIGEWVLRTACRQAKIWHDSGFTSLRMSVNISPRQMQDQNVPALVKEVLESTGLRADALQLEITEWAAMQDMDLTVSTLNDLRKMGVRISIDDFGTSYSSLGYLKRFPISSLKIDQSFVRDMTEDADDAAITKAIIAMGNVLGLSVVAEGVEMEQQLAMLVPEKCTEVQGDLLGRPGPCESITSLLQEGHSLLPELSIPSTGDKKKPEPPADRKNSA